jgi:hypothetical protein
MIRSKVGQFRTDRSRRDFLRAGGLAALGAASLGPSAGALGIEDRALIILLLVGGPSQLETWDPKPEAPAEVRGPFGSIATAVPGIRIGEHLPRLARRMDKLALIRSLHHDAAPIHETGFQLVQTGRLAGPSSEPPHLGAIVARRLGARGGQPTFVILPGPIGQTGVGVSKGQSAGPLGAACEPVFHGGDPHVLGAVSGRIREAYGSDSFGRACLQARRHVEAGARVVVVNMFDTVFGRPTWDCHGHGPFSTLDDYARQVLPSFDRGLATLIDDLERLGRLDQTLILAVGEFGRTPRLNQAGGRDHWPRVWSAVLAGGGIRGGQVIGASDRSAGEPIDRPIRPADLLATIARPLGIEPGGTVPTADGRTWPILDGGQPIAEMLA